MDTARFDEVCSAYRRRLVAMLKRRTGDAEAAEDLAQETLLRAFRYLDRMDPSRPVWPWLRAIALNRAATWAGRQPCLAPLEGVERSADVDDIAEVESRQAMRALIGDLTARQQRALWLRYVEDQDSHRAAAAMGLSVTAFKQLLYRARARVRAILEAGGSILAPGVVPLRALRRLLSRGPKSGSDTQRLAEALAPVGAAAMALILVMGGAPGPSADALPAQAQPPAAREGLSSVDRSVDPGADAVRRAAGIARAPGGVKRAEGVEGSAKTSWKARCTGAQACAHHGDLPEAPVRPTGINPRIPPMVQADIPLVGDVCTRLGCLVEDPGHEPGGDLGRLLGDPPGRIHSA